MDTTKDTFNLAIKNYQEGRLDVAQELLNLFDTILKKDDYLIIEDSVQKQDIISHFSIEKEPKYKLDQFFLDFFGTNVTCCINSIFKCY